MSPPFDSDLALVTCLTNRMCISDTLGHLGLGHMKLCSFHLGLLGPRCEGSNPPSKKYKNHKATLLKLPHGNPSAYSTS